MEAGYLIMQQPVDERMKLGSLVAGLERSVDFWMTGKIGLISVLTFVLRGYFTVVAYRSA